MEEETNSSNQVGGSPFVGLLETNQLCEPQLCEPQLCEPPIAEQVTQIAVNDGASTTTSIAISSTNKRKTASELQSDTADSPPKKKSKSSHFISPYRNSVFHIEISEPKIFKEFVDIIGNILSDCEFIVKKPNRNGALTGLFVNCVDPNRIALIHAQLACRVNFADPVKTRVDFRIDLQRLIAWLRSISNGSILEIFMKDVDGVERVHFESYDPDHPVEKAFLWLPVLTANPPSQRINDMAFPFTVELDLTQFKRIIKTARDLNIEDIRFEIHSDSATSPIDKLQDGEKAISDLFLRVTATHQVSTGYTFHSRTEWSKIKYLDGDVEKSNVVLKSVKTKASDKIPKWETLPVCCDQTFPSSYLFLFIKSMQDKHDFSLRLKMRQGFPLLIDFSLSEKTKIRFILAPKAE